MDFYSDKLKVAVDLLPFGEIEEFFTLHFHERRADLHVLGLQEVLEDSITIKIEDKIANISPLPGMVILKLIAWSDLPEERGDVLFDILIIIQHYFELSFDAIVNQHYDLLNSLDP
jgi:predicted nucleotidyltransferase